MNRLNNEQRAQVINCLIAGCSIRSTVRMTGVAMKTVMRVLVEVGAVCADYQDKVFRNLSTRRLQLDEMWAWIYCKEKNRTEEIARNANPNRYWRITSEYCFWQAKGGCDSKLFKIIVLLAYPYPPWLRLAALWRIQRGGDGDLEG